MKNAKKLVALLLSLALVLSLGACGGNGGSSTSSEASPSSTTEESGAAAESGDESQAETAETGEFQLPIVDEPTTLSYFVADDSNAAIMTTDWNDNEFYQEMERRTGVHLEFEMVSSADYQTNFNLMIASGNLADMIYVGASGLFAALYTMPSVYEAASEDPNMNLAPVNPPVMNEGDEGHIRLRDSYTSGNTAISADSENWEVALRWLDYLYTEEGALLANYGVEGDTFEFDENGEPVFTDKILNNENGWTMTQTVASYLCPSAGIANWSDWTRELAGVPEKDQACYDVWSEFSDDWRLPSSVTLTQEESTERAALYADISTIVKEQTAQFISGALDIESNWDAYISALEASGMERAIEITQAAYDRYLARVE